MERRITQRDLAEALGVDVSTVSKALKGDPAVARGTVERVRSKAAEIGYVPDPVLGALAAYRQRLQPEAYRATIGWLSDCGPEAMKKRFPAYSDYLQGARERAAELGYRIDPVYLDARTGFSEMAVEKILRARGIRAVVVAPLANPDTQMDLDWEHYASVAIGYTLKAPKLDRISNDHFETMSDLLEIIRRRGYQRVGCYLWEVDNERMARRARSAFLSVSQGAGVEVVTYRDFEPGAFVRWIRRGKFDAVVFQGRAQFEALKRAGVAVPDDLGAVGYALERAGDCRHVSQQPTHRGIGGGLGEWKISARTVWFRPVRPPDPRGQRLAGKQDPCRTRPVRRHGLSFLSWSLSAVMAGRCASRKSRRSWALSF